MLAGGFLVVGAQVFWVLAGGFFSCWCPGVLGVGAQVF